LGVGVLAHEPQQRVSWRIAGVSAIGRVTHS
jgi:hypothetical protein